MLNRIRKAREKARTEAAAKRREAAKKNDESVNITGAQAQASVVDAENYLQQALAGLLGPQFITRHPEGYRGDLVKNKTIGLRVIMFDGELQFPAGSSWQYRNIPLFGPALEVFDSAGKIVAQVRAERVNYVSGPTTILRAPQTPSRSATELNTNTVVTGF